MTTEGNTVVSVGSLVSPLGKRHLPLSEQMDYPSCQVDFFPYCIRHETIIGTSASLS